VDFDISVSFASSALDGKDLRCCYCEVSMQADSQSESYNRVSVFSWTRKRCQRHLRRSRARRRELGETLRGSRPGMRNGTFDGRGDTANDYHIHHCRVVQQKRSSPFQTYLKSKMSTNFDFLNTQLFAAYQSLMYVIYEQQYLENGKILPRASTRFESKNSEQETGII